MSDEALKTTSLTVSQEVVQILRDEMPKKSCESLKTFGWTPSYVCCTVTNPHAYLAPNNSRMLKTSFSETAMYIIVRSSISLTTHIWII